MIIKQTNTGCLLGAGVVYEATAMLILSVHAYHEGEPTIEKPQSYKTGSGKSALCTPTLVQADRQPTEVACTQTRLRVNNIALPLSFALNYVQPHELEETVDVYMF